MMMALCFSCGEVKFGALCPCPVCQVESSGDMELDIAFNDHNCAVETLHEFGAVIRCIGTEAKDPETRFWTFIHYVSNNHPSILKAEPQPHLRDEVERVLRSIVLPAVTLREKA